MSIGTKRKLFTQEIKEKVHTIMQKQAKTQDTHQVSPSFEQENSVNLAQKSENPHQNDGKIVEKNEKVEVKNLLQSCENDEKRKDENGVGQRERLKRHRKEVAGEVWIPELWGQEDFLKDWIDSSTFDKCLMPHSIMSARASLIQEGTRASSTSLSVENSC